MTRRLPLALLLAITGCAADDGTPPTITDLVAGPTTIPVGVATTIDGTLRFSDPDGDLELLAVTVTSGGNRTELPPVAITLVDALTEGTVGWQVILQAPAAGAYVAELRVLDHAGNESNALTATITAQ